MYSSGGCLIDIHTSFIQENAVANVVCEMATILLGLNVLIRDASE